jgi:hypothetical protein
VAHNFLQISSNNSLLYALIQNEKNISNNNCQSYSHFRTWHILALCSQV